MPIEPSPKNQAGIAVLAMQRLPIGLPVAAACFLAGPVVASANSALRRFTGIPLFDPTERFRMEKGQPCDRVQLGVPWAWHIYSARLGDTRFGKISCGAGRRRRLASEPHQLPHARLRRDACPGPRFRRPWPGHEAPATARRQLRALAVRAAGGRGESGSPLRVPPVRLDSTAAGPTPLRMKPA